MRLDALKRKQGRHSGNYVPMEHNLTESTSRAEFADSVNESETTVQRFIRLNYLIPELLELVDEKTLKLRPAVELSYMRKESQSLVYVRVFSEKCMNLTYDQARALREKDVNQETFTVADVDVVLMGKNTEKIKKNMKVTKRIKNLFPKTVRTTDQTEDYVYKAVKVFNTIPEDMRDSAEDYLAMVVDFYEKNHREGDS